MRGFCMLAVALLVIVSAADARADDAAKSSQRVRMIIGGEYWGEGNNAADDDFVAWLAQVRPDVVHQGILGPELASVIAYAGEKKAITPLRPKGIDNMAAYHAWWKERLPLIQKHGTRVQATISMTNVWGHHETGAGWFGYYADGWEEDVLGKRPSPRAIDLMEVDRHGKLLSDGKDDWARYRGCVNNPLWRTAVKAMVKAGVDAGFDGFMVQYPHARGECACDYCQTAFKKYLRDRYSDALIAERFGITDLDKHVFETTAPRAKQPGPIDIEARAFSAICVKAFVDDVFISYGRSLKPDLLVSIWTHHRNFLSPDVLFQKAMTNTEFWKITDERMLLPLEDWGRDESYVWYSTPSYQSDLANGLLGDTSHDTKYLRAMAGDTPSLTLKYDYFRWRVTAAEAMANGGIVFNNWSGGWSGGEERDTPHMKRYFDFIRKHDDKLYPREPAGEVAVIYPRTALYWGDATMLERFRRVGRILAEHHIPYDVVVDERIAMDSFPSHRAIIVPETKYLSEAQGDTLSQLAASRCHVITFAGAGGTRDVCGGAEHVYDGDLADGDAFVKFMRDEAKVVTGEAGIALSSFDAPHTVQVSMHAQPRANRLIVHLVNYNRDESKGRRELPIAADAVPAQLELAHGRACKAVTFYTPEVEAAATLDFKQDGTRVTFTVPSFLVYGMCVVEYEPES